MKSRCGRKMWAAAVDIYKFIPDRLPQSLKNLRRWRYFLRFFAERILLCVSR